MGLMDKVKLGAEQALGKAQQGVSQGQAKIDQVQAKRQADVLFRNLGAAYYAQQREGGSDEAMTAALRELDEHVSAHGPIDAPAAPAQPEASAGPGDGLEDEDTAGAPPAPPAPGSQAGGSG